MSVLTYLNNLASTVDIADWERNNINASIRNITSKIDSHFSNVSDRFVFGSYQRKTILRRSRDSNSDVDMMVVFTDGSSFKPQTLLDRLKKFAKDNYSNNIYLSSPTIVIELGHIKFELLPAYYSYGPYYIPAPSSSYLEWMTTDPNSDTTRLDDKNRNSSYQIKKVVRLFKYWNVLNGRLYSSFGIEKYVIDSNFWDCNNLKDYFYEVCLNLSTNGLSIANTAKVDRLKKIVNETKELENTGYPISAENKIKTLFE